MKIVFSPEEIKAIDNYAKAKVNIFDPYKMCEDNGTCCGCQKQVEYEKRIGNENALLPDPSILHLPEVEAYIRAVAAEDFCKERLVIALYVYNQAVEDLRNAKDVLGIVDNDEN